MLRPGRSIVIAWAWMSVLPLCRAHAALKTPYLRHVTLALLVAADGGSANQMK
jgi:hypothetical protein